MRRAISLQSNVLARLRTKDNLPHFAGFIVLLLLSLLLWWPTRYLPFWWEQAIAFESTWSGLNIVSLGSHLVSSVSLFQPPLFTLMLTFLRQYVGASFLWPHLLMLPLLSLYLCATFGITRRLQPLSQALLTTFIVFCTPFVIASYGFVAPHLPSATLGLLGVWALLSERKMLGSILTTSGVLTGVAAWFIAPVFLVYYILRERKKIRIQEGLYAFLPLITLLSWIFLHGRSSGFSWLSQLIPHLSWVVQAGAWDVSLLLFWQQFRWVLTLGLLVSLGILWYKKAFAAVFEKHWELKLISIAAVLGFVMSTFVAIPEPLLFLGIFPLYVLLATFFIAQALQALKAPQIYYYSLLLPAVLFLLLWHPQKTTEAYEFLPIKDLSYIDMIYVWREAGVYTQIAHSGAELYGGFPESMLFAHPEHGYVSEALEVKRCADFSLSSEKKQIVMIHPYSITQQSCRELLETANLAPLNRFQHGGKWLELYSVTATDSSEISQQE